MKYIFEELYKKEEKADGSIVYIPYDVNEKIDNMTICGKSIKEIIDIVSGLEIERMTDIQMTMKNLTYLFNKLMQEQNQHMQFQIDKMMHSWIENEETEEK